MSKQHSRLAPSSASRRMACPGSRALIEQHGREEQTESSAEGTLAHQAASEQLIGLPFNTDQYTKEMLDGALLYASTVTRFITAEALHVEQTLSMSDTIHPESFGTPDAWGVDGTALHVFDYKYGFTPVDAYENWQLIAYASGALALNPQVTEIYLHIIQPRDFMSASSHKMWAMEVQELKHYETKLKMSEAESMSMSAPLIVNSECKYCPARHACPALRQAAFGAAELSYQHLHYVTPPAYVGSELKLLQEARDILDYRISALETEAQYMLQSGKRVDNFYLESTEGRLTWSVPIEKVIEAGILLGVDLKKDGVITPTQALKAGLPETVLTELAERKHSVKLAKIDLKKSKSVFKQH